MTTVGEGSWVYNKLYLGAASSKMDALVLKLASVLNQEPDALSWFYLRYYDTSGVHLRVRVKVPSERRGLLQERLEHYYNELLGRISNWPSSSYKAMILPVYSQTLISDEPSYLRAVRDTYEPEFDRFGGSEGVQIAEKLFNASSKAAVSILSHEISGSCSRKSLAPTLMQSCREVFVPPNEESQFWLNYEEFWLRETPHAASLKEAFRQKAKELSASGTAGYISTDRNLCECAGILQAYKEALQRGADEYEVLRSTDDVTLPDREGLAASFIHLMNNRLGINITEEAYLATLCSFNIA